MNSAHKFLSTLIQCALCMIYQDTLERPVLGLQPMESGSFVDSEVVADRGSSGYITTKHYSAECVNMFVTFFKMNTNSAAKLMPPLSKGPVQSYKARSARE